MEVVGRLAALVGTATKRARQHEAVDEAPARGRVVQMTRPAPAADEDEFPLAGTGTFG